VLTIILVILLVLLLFGSAPVWRHSQGYGWYPAGGLGLLLVIVLVLLLLGYIPH
jgi:multisubunit Na+/H+ antiporter MnhB subunit